MLKPSARETEFEKYPEKVSRLPMFQGHFETLKLCHSETLVFQASAYLRMPSLAITPLYRSESYFLR